MEEVKAENKLTDEIVREIADKLLNGELKMLEVEKLYNTNKSTVSRKLKKINITFNKSTHKYEYNENLQFKDEVLDFVQIQVPGTYNTKVIEKQVIKESQKNLKKFTVEIDTEVLKALKRLKIEEDIKINEFVENLLRANIDERFFRKY